MKAPSIGGAGLPPPPPDVDTSEREGDGGGGYVKKDDAYWADHPLRAGTYEFFAYVSKVIWWGPDGVAVTFRVVDWDNATGRSREHHGRPIRWDQSMRAEMLERYASGDEKAKKAFAFWRRDIVGAYTACGFPEDVWEKKPDGSVVPPWHLFFVHGCPDGTRVPIMLQIKVVVQPQREKFPNVRSIIRVNGPLQAPLPYDVHPPLAEFHAWRVKETRTINVPSKGYSTEVAVLDKDQFVMGHCGLATYKDLP